MGRFLDWLCTPKYETIEPLTQPKEKEWKVDFADGSSSTNEDYKLKPGCTVQLRAANYREGVPLGSLLMYDEIRDPDDNRLLGNFLTPTDTRLRSKMGFTKYLFCVPEDHFEVVPQNQPIRHWEKYDSGDLVDCMGIKFIIKEVDKDNPDVYKAKVLDRDDIFDIHAAGTRILKRREKEMPVRVLFEQGDLVEAVRGPHRGRRFYLTKPTIDNGVLTWMGEIIGAGNIASMIDETHLRLVERVQKKKEPETPDKLDKVISLLEKIVENSETAVSTPKEAAPAAMTTVAPTKKKMAIDLNLGDQILIDGRWHKVLYIDGSVVDTDSYVVILAKYGNKHDNERRKYKVNQKITVLDEG